MLEEDEDHIELWSGAFWGYIGGIFGFVCLAGAMAGLTIGLMSLDRLSLEVLIRSGEKHEQTYAKAILPLVKRTHLLLVTLLLCNAVANEALPIFLDRLMSPIWAIAVSVTLVLFFGEIIPQSIFKEHSLCIGAHLSWFVWALIYLCYPIAWPISKLLDRLIGSDDDDVSFRRKQLKTFVKLHAKQEGRGGDLSIDETQIIDGVLELGEKRAMDIMVSSDDIFSLDEETTLTRDMLIIISERGHSRIPIYRGGKEKKNDFVGCLLVKSLILREPGENVKIKDCKLNHLPRIEAVTPLFELLDIFQEERSHLGLVYANKDRKGEKLVGIISLEDVVEEIIKEEIYDETDSVEMKFEKDTDVMSSPLRSRGNSGEGGGGRGKEVPGSPNGMARRYGGKTSYVEFCDYPDENTMMDGSVNAPKGEGTHRGAVAAVEVLRKMRSGPRSKPKTSMRRAITDDEKGEADVEAPLLPS